MFALRTAPRRERYHYLGLGDPLWYLAGHVLKDKYSYVCSERLRDEGALKEVIRDGLCTWQQGRFRGDVNWSVSRNRILDI